MFIGPITFARELETKYPLLGHNTDIDELGRVNYTRIKKGLAQDMNIEYKRWKDKFAIHNRCHSNRGSCTRGEISLLVGFANVMRLPSLREVAILIEQEYLIPYIALTAPPSYDDASNVPDVHTIVNPGSRKKHRIKHFSERISPQEFVLPVKVSNSLIESDEIGEIVEYSSNCRALDLSKEQTLYTLIQEQRKELLTFGCDDGDIKTLTSDQCVLYVHRSESHGIAPIKAMITSKRLFGKSIFSKCSVCYCETNCFRFTLVIRDATCHKLSVDDTP